MLKNAEANKQPNTDIPNVPRSVDACIIKTEEENQENQKTL